MFQLRAGAQVVELLLPRAEFRLQVAALLLDGAFAPADVQQVRPDEFHHPVQFIELDFTHRGVFGEFVQRKSADGVRLPLLGVQGRRLIVQRRQLVGNIRHGRLGLEDFLVVRLRQEGLLDLNVHQLAGFGWRQADAHRAFINPAGQFAEGDARCAGVQGRFSRARHTGAVGIDSHISDFR